jgi:hypothetical protein
MNTKICKKCGCEKNIEIDFQYGRNQCKSCRSLYMKERRILNKEHIVKYRKNYNDTHKKERNEYLKVKRIENPEYYSWRKLLYHTIKRMNKVKEEKTIDLLGYSALDLKLHIEKLFTPGMNWANRSEWHIDHIKPVSSFDKNTPISIVCELSNLQPLWKTTRIINGITYEGNLNKKNNYNT